MAPPKDAVATFAQVVGAAKAGVPELEGPGLADKWEGHTEAGLRLWAAREAGRPGFALRWEYHNALGHKIQNAVLAVKVSGLADLATAVRAANADSIPDVLPPNAGPGLDPLLARRAVIADYPDGRQVFAPPPGDGLTGFSVLSSPPPPPPAPDDEDGEDVDEPAEDTPLYPSPPPPPAAPVEPPDGQPDQDVEAAADQGYGDGPDAAGVAGSDQLPQ